MRRLTAAAAAGLALAALAGCRTAPNVAAYVGEDQVTVAEVEAAVDERLADPVLQETAGADEVAYTRQVLTSLVQAQVHDVAAQRYGVEVTDAEVRARITELIGGDDPDQVYAQLAQQGVSRQDAFAAVRQQLVRQEIAEEEGLADSLSAEALQQRYEEVRTSSARVRLGYITVPDQPTADQVVAALQADPRRYPQLAQQYPGAYTLAELETRAPEEIPGPLAQQAAGAAPGTAFSVPVEETGGVVVGFVAEQVYPTFEELRPQLEQEAADEVDQAAQQVVDDLRTELDVVVNPRYGELAEGGIRAVEGGVVDILSADG